MNALDKILSLAKDSDYIFHLGDNINDARYLEKKFPGGVHMVKGNCDYDDNGDVEKIVDIEGKKFFLTHGDRYGVNYGLEKIFYKGLELCADVIIFGHTHRKVLIKESGVYILNPGSLSLPRDNSRSVAKIMMDSSENIDIEFLEF